MYMFTYAIGYSNRLLSYIYVYVYIYFKGIVILRFNYEKN